MIKQVLKLLTAQLHHKKLNHEFVETYVTRVSRKTGKYQTLVN